MPIDISPDTERLVREEIRSGHFSSADELIVLGLHVTPAGKEHQGRNLVEICAMVQGAADDLSVTRNPSSARSVSFE